MRPPTGLRLSYWTRPTFPRAPSHGSISRIISRMGSTDSGQRNPLTDVDSLPVHAHVDRPCVHNWLAQSGCMVADGADGTCKDVTPSCFHRLLIGSRSIPFRLFCFRIFCYLGAC